LRELQGILQVTMGWDGIHLFQFDFRAIDYGSWKLHAASPDIALSGFGFRRNYRFAYIYDMGIIGNTRSVSKPYWMRIRRSLIPFARVGRAHARLKNAVDSKAI